MSVPNNSKHLTKQQRINFGLNLDNLLQIEGILTSDLANALPIDQETLSGIIAGRDNSRKVVLETIARGLGVSADLLLRSSKQFDAQYRPGSAKLYPPTHRPRSSSKTIIRSTKQIVFQSGMLIAALSEALEFDQQRHHNHPPSALRIEPELTQDIRELIEELRALNRNLEGLQRGGKEASAARGAAKKSVAASKKRLNQFLDAFIPTFGKSVAVGSGMLVVGIVATLLYQLGLPETVFDQVLRKMR